MTELPEAVTLADQIVRSLGGKSVDEVTVLKSPHKWAWFFGDPHTYPDKLTGKTVSGAEDAAGMIEMYVSGASLLFHDGPNLRHYERTEDLPKKHQLLLRFTDQTYLCVSVQMYGGIACFPTGTYENKYYRMAHEKPSPLSDEFSQAYFEKLLSQAPLEKLSAKAFLATEQRIPGLGNGVLQDLLFLAQIHPRRKMSSLSDDELEAMYGSIRSTLGRMTEKGGRDTEKDLFGAPGGYGTLMSRHTVGTACPECGETIQKASYQGGSVYFCPGCQQA
jgi:formamidopyrimidine-DNA glycosylase